MNARSALLAVFVALTIVLASTTVYEAGVRTTLTSTSMSTSTSTSTATSVSTTTSTTTQTTTITSTFDLIKALTGACLSHIGAIVSYNATTLAAQYETNATLQYTLPNGTPPNGTFDGSANITRFYVAHNAETGAFNLSNLAAANDTYSIAMSNDGNTGNVTSNVVLYGNGGECCWPNFSGTAAFENVAFDITYTLQGDRWLISTESLTYIGATHCAQVVISPDGSVYTCLNYGSA